MSEFIPQNPQIETELPGELLPKGHKAVLVGYVGDFKIIAIVDAGQKDLLPVGWVVLCPNGKVLRGLDSLKMAIKEAKRLERERDQELKRKNAPSELENIVAEEKREEESDQDDSHGPQR